MDLETNSREVLLAAEESWGAQERMFNHDPVRICLGVSESDSESRAPLAAIRAREHLMSIVADAEKELDEQASQQPQKVQQDRLEFEERL